ncbi:MAG: hypothetical protein KA319_05285 [Ferruginibacter sp.]|nr:hypothetical protein [Ferruginibacter sp.]
MKTNKLILVLLLFVSFAMVGCKKDFESKYDFKYKKNGTWITYNGLTNALGEITPNSTNPSTMDLNINGNSEDNTEVINFLILTNTSTANIGSYNTNNSSNLYYTYISYIKTVGSNLNSYEVDDAPGRAPSYYTINITSITADEIKGNFTGNYLFEASGIAGNDIVEITEGEFNVKRVQ